MPFVQKMVEYNKERYSDQGDPYDRLMLNIINDAFLDGQNLYLLIKEVPNPINNFGTLDCNKVVVLHLDDEKIKPKAILDLSMSTSEEKKNYSSICISEDGKILLAFDYENSELCSFSLPNLETTN